MIIIIPDTLRTFNIPALADAKPLQHPVTQIGSQPSNAQLLFTMEPRLLTSPLMLRTLEQATHEGYAIAFVSGGGRTLEERQAAAVWAFLPTVELTKLTVEDLLDMGKTEQRLTTSHSAPVVPTKRGFDRFKGRPGAEPTLPVIEVGDTSESAAEEAEEQP